MGKHMKTTAYIAAVLIAVLVLFAGTSLQTNGGGADGPSCPEDISKETKQDLKYLNYALASEYAQYVLFRDALEEYSFEDFENSTAVGDCFADLDSFMYLETVRDYHMMYAENLTALIRSLGGEPVQNCQVDFEVDQESIESFLEVAAESLQCYDEDRDSDNVCSGHGTCVGPNLCMCDDGWAGPQCDCNENLSDICRLCLEPNQCCQDSIRGDLCYDPEIYHCIQSENYTLLCGIEAGACGTICYNTTFYECVDGEIEPIESAFEDNEDTDGENDTTDGGDVDTTNGGVDTTDGGDVDVTNGDVDTTAGGVDTTEGGDVDTTDGAEATGGAAEETAGEGDSETTAGGVEETEVVDVTTGGVDTTVPVDVSLPGAGEEDGDSDSDSRMNTKFKKPTIQAKNPVDINKRVPDDLSAANTLFIGRALCFAVVMALIALLF